MKNYFQFLMVFLLLNFTSFSQNSEPPQIKIHLVFGTSNLNLNKTYCINNQKDSVSFETIKCYISGILLFKEDKIVWRDNNNYYLIDAENPNSFNIPLDFPKEIDINQIKFYCGIDSLTNVSGAFGGALDPTNGMYWTWQNGYINTKLEGKSNLCKNTDNSFELHLGGYQFPYNSLQTVTIEVEAFSTVQINLNFEVFLKNANLENNHHVMSPSIKAIEIAKAFANSFQLRK